MDTYEKECRICLSEEVVSDDELITPCRCNGTSKYVHRSCLNKWRSVNIGREANSYCMECREKYIIRRKYELEKKRIFNNSFRTFICSSYIISGLSGTFWSMFVPKSNKYLISLLNQGNPEPTINICNYNYHINNTTCVKSITMSQFISPPNGFYPCVIFHMYFLLTINTILFTLYYYKTICQKIKRKKRYFLLNILTLCFWNIYSIRFFIVYYISSSIFYEPSMFFGIAHVSLLLDGGCFFNFIKSHNSKIKIMNEIDNEEIILSWYNNPTHTLEFTELELPGLNGLLEESDVEETGYG